MDFKYKKISTVEISEPFKSSPHCNNLICADGKRGLLYIGTGSRLTLYKPKYENESDCKIVINLPQSASFIALNCNNTSLAIYYTNNKVSIYDVNGLTRKNLNHLNEITISSSIENVCLTDLKWNPVNPEILCTIASDYTIGMFNLNKPSGISIMGRQNVEALCLDWNPSGRNFVIGCKNGNVMQLRLNLSVEKEIARPSSPVGGEIVSIMWLGNYTYCAVFYEGLTKIFTVTTFYCAENETVATYTIHDGFMNQIQGGTITPRFFLSYIPEWNIIIVARNDCVETGVIGSADGGKTWTIWEIDGNERAELQFTRPYEAYPFVGLAVDKSIREKIFIDENTLAEHPFPVLYILGTSGHFFSFHIIYTKPCVNICSPPDEVLNLLPESEIEFESMPYTQEKITKVLKRHGDLLDSIVKRMNTFEEKKEGDNPSQSVITSLSSNLKNECVPFTSSPAEKSTPNSIISSSNIFRTYSATSLPTFSTNCFGITPANIFGTPPARPLFTFGAQTNATTSTTVTDSSDTTKFSLGTVTPTVTFTSTATSTVSTEATKQTASKITVNDNQISTRPSMVLTRTGFVHRKKT